MEIATNKTLFTKQRSPHHTQEKHTSGLATQHSNNDIGITHALSGMNDTKTQQNSASTYAGNLKDQKINYQNGKK